MKLIPFIIALAATSLSAADKQIPNRLIDYDGFMKNAAEVAKIREQHRVTEEQFIKMAAAPGTVIYDARSDDKYKLLHVKGAKHLSLTSTTAEELAKLAWQAGFDWVYYENSRGTGPHVHASVRADGPRMPVLHQKGKAK